MLAMDRTTMICRPTAYAATRTPTKTPGFLLQELLLVHHFPTTVPFEPSYTPDLSHLLQRA